MREHSALVLEILKQNKALKMSISEQEETVSTLRHYSQSPVSFAEIQELCLEVASILNRACQKNTQEHDLVRKLAKSGELLWENIFSRQVKDKLKSSQIENLILSIDEELINIPWELFYDGTNFLCLNFNLGRSVLTKTIDTPAGYRDFSSVPKMLVLANPTNDLKSAYVEGVNIKNQFDRKKHNVHIDFKSTYIDRMYVKKNICDYDIVHFAGHCEYMPDNPKDSGWVLSDGKFSVRDILAMGSAASLPHLVFSNACHSAEANKNSFYADYQERNYSLASAFLFAGVRHYIGTVRRIEDPVSLSFSKEFYIQLISGKSVGESVKLARVKLMKEYGIASIYWASYLLYGDPNFILFRRKPKPARPGMKKRLLYNRKVFAGVCLTATAISIFIFLYIWLPTINPSTYVLHLRSKSEFKKGNNQEAISLSRGIIKNHPLFLAAYPLMADAYQRIGDRENALKYYFDYALFSEKRMDKKNLASAYIKIGWFYHLEGDYIKAMEFYNKAKTVAEENKDKLNEAVALRKMAVWFTDKEDYAQALQLLTKSSEINRERRGVYEHRYNLACDYFDIGLVFSNKNDFITAKEFYAKSRKLFEGLNLKDELSDYYFNVGETYVFDKEYNKALEYYLRGIKIDVAQGNKANLAGDYNMVGELFVEMDKITDAEKYFYMAVEIAREINSRVELAGAFYNLGLLYKREGKKNKAREYLRESQEIYKMTDELKYSEIKNELLGMD